MKVHKTTLFSTSFCPLLFVCLVSDKAPVSQLNPKKKIFETIQPGLLHVSVPDNVYFLNSSPSVRFYNPRDQRGCLGQPSDEDCA